jgi:hypothetical protein|tara:strand:+ start:37684 stop:37971 length:288 start_codon:yes stop_codon:yes gene_type:complete
MPKDLTALETYKAYKVGQLWLYQPLIEPSLSYGSTNAKIKTPFVVMIIDTDCGEERLTYNFYVYREARAYSLEAREWHRLVSLGKYKLLDKPARL